MEVVVSVNLREVMVSLERLSSFKMRQKLVFLVKEDLLLLTASKEVNLARRERILSSIQMGGSKTLALKIQPLSLQIQGLEF